MPFTDDGAPEPKGPHRVPVQSSGRVSPNGNAGAPQAVSHHWVALRKAWEVPQLDEKPHHYGLVSDGTRVIALRQVIEMDGPQETEVTAYDGATGKRLWRQQVTGWFRESTPVAAGETVIVPLGRNESMYNPPGEFLALDTTTGQERWRAKVKQRAWMDDRSMGMPGPEPGAILDGVFYYADGPALIGRDLVTGEVRHQLVSKRNLVVAGPLAAGDQLVVITKPDMSGDIDLDRDYTVRDLFVMSKTLKQTLHIEFDHLNEITTSGDIVIARDGGVSGGHVWAVDARSGKDLWDLELPPTADVGLPVGDVLPLVDDEYRVTGYDILTGKQLWTLPPRKGSFDDRALGVADGTLFGLGHGVEIIDSHTGKVVFGNQFTPRGGGLVVAAGGRIVIYNHDGFMGFD